MTVPFTGRLTRRATMLSLILALLGAPAPAQAQGAPSCNDESNLLAVEDAFVLSAQATAADQIALRWKIAPGCYLYRHQLKVQADAGFAAQPLQLPAGKAHEDE